MQIRETDGWTKGEAVGQDKSERVMEMEGGRGIRGGGEVFALAWQNLEVIKDSVQ